MSRRVLVLVLFAAVLSFGLGCGGGPPAAPDPQEARAAVQTALDAWKGGATLDSLKQRQPPMTVIDTSWKAGQKLTDFTLSPSTNQIGADVRFDAELSLQDGSGRERREKVTYSVVIDKVIVIVREGDF